jgi:tetratricopeptide (TPR) repeat protein
LLNEANKTFIDVAEAEQLLELLDGLPLAIAQAGAYLQESGTDLTTYLRFYKQQWSELMASNQFADTPLQDYPSGSVWTTWAISYQAIREKHEATANLLLLWSFLDNKDLWYGLFARAYSRSPIAAAMLSEWIGDIADSELKFIEAMKLLRNYSLVEEAAETTGYATHPVVHQWAHHSQGKRFETQLSRLAEIAVGWGAPGVYDQDHYAMHRRIFPHAQVCYSWVMNSETIWYRIHEGHNDEELRTFLQALNNLAILYQEQNKSHDAEQLYKRVLREYEEALGPSHISTLNVLNDLGIVYYVQGRLGEAEQMYERALREKEKKLGSSHISTLETVHNLGVVYDVQGRLGEAEQMYERALRGLEKKLGSSHTSTLNTVDNLGTLYCGQGRLGEAEQMYKRALRELEKKLGSSHILTLRTVNNLGVLYNEQNKLEEAEQMHKWALQEKEKVLGSSHILTLQTVSNLGIVYCKQGKLYDAEQMYKRALQGFEELFGSDGIQQHETAFEVLENMGDLYVIKGETSKAQAAYTRALSGLQSVLGESNKRCIDLEAEIKALSLRTQEKEAQPTLQLTEEESLPQLDTEKKSSQFSLRKLIRRKLQ